MTVLWRIKFGTKWSGLIFLIFYFTGVEPLSVWLAKEIIWTVKKQKVETCA